VSDILNVVDIVGDIHRTYIDVINVVDNLNVNRLSITLEVYRRLVSLTQHRCFAVIEV